MTNPKEIEKLIEEIMHSLMSENDGDCKWTTIEEALRTLAQKMQEQHEKEDRIIRIPTIELSCPKCKRPTRKGLLVPQGHCHICEDIEKAVAEERKKWEATLIKLKEEQICLKHGYIKTDCAKCSEFLVNHAIGMCKEDIKLANLSTKEIKIKLLEARNEEVRKALNEILEENERIAVLNKQHPPIERCQTWNVGQKIREVREKLGLNPEGEKT